ncbi:bifunctional folylpolyglutamate synthase/dihydrofolate synthase [Dehalogenimonas alkenigignens]|uniref:tetrahydrofolate synthase n=1 Tax=Dehalogenimonas alkenigignens TaxID=1217799 RepID=A0A0W0GGK0_9CHLR|nr:folylpolyglutamate synthase/dihydrofolate synthase family protein [Dehalogenimonas alkenigignens]KTB47684.1 folylpolyglutamate synthase/ dihydrofolate synthase [Dehalogenimonas alkenigignens]PVV84048.1 bifunctional folylpolyglutamate synthase/dihydrofolate synthase [Dehalogenimonas alkenigignens]
MRPEYHAALLWLYGFVDYEAVPRPRDDARYDLRRVRLLLERLGEPHLKARTVHIAGSKGKGSTAAMIFAVLREAGYQTGLYTSPHLIETYERFKINDRFIGEDELIAGIERLKPIVEAINAEARYGALTTFEIMTALAFDFFAAHNVDWQVIEVGLGGRLDATNVARPDLCVITTIALEHTEVLGDTLGQIASEKAGIIKSGVPVIMAPQAPEARRVIEDVCRQRGAHLVRVDPEQAAPSEYRGGRQAFSLAGRLGRYDISLPLLGTFQRVNCAAAVAALETLAGLGVAGLDKTAIELGLAKTVWPGRFQVLDKSPLIIADGAHNPAAAAELAASLDAYFGGRDLLPHPAVLVIGASADKNVGGMAEVLAPLFEEVIVTRTRHPRAMEPRILGRAFEALGKRVNHTSTTAEALVLGVQMAGAGGLVCVTGSLFAVGETLELWQAGEAKA